MIFSKLEFCYAVGMSLIPIILLVVEAASASGHDVQLKDLRGSYFYAMGGGSAPSKECTKLLLNETKKYGRLTHCNPEQEYIMCKPKQTDVKLFLFEAKEACELSLKKGVEPPVDED